jgi:general stress protein 26
MEERELREKVNDLLTEQRLAVLSSYMKDQPYPNLIAFVHTNNLKNLYFATLKNSIKYTNIKDNPKISLLVDNRDNTPTDISEAIALSVFGTISEIDCKDEQCKDIYLRKHPYLKDFLEMPDCALLKIIVEKYLIVSNFQNVNILNIME